MSRNTPFSELLRTNLPDGTSGREFGRKAGLGESTGTAYLNGRHGTVSAESMEKIHDAYPTIAVAAMREALGLPAEARQWTPPREVNLLDPEVQDAIGELIKVIARGERGGLATPAQKTVTTARPAAPGPDNVMQMPNRRRKLSDAESRAEADAEVERRRQRAEAWKPLLEQGKLAARTEKGPSQGELQRRALDEATEQAEGDGGEQ